MFIKADVIKWWIQLVTGYGLFNHPKSRYLEKRDRFLCICGHYHQQDHILFQCSWLKRLRGIWDEKLTELIGRNFNRTTINYIVFGQFISDSTERKNMLESIIKSCWYLKFALSETFIHPMDESDSKIVWE